MREGRHREAHALHADAVADGRVRKIELAAGDDQPRIDAAHFAGSDTPKVLNDSGEHSCRRALPTRASGGTHAQPQI